MGFLSGRAAFLRFKVNGAAPREFGEEHLDALDQHNLMRSRGGADGTSVGWVAGDHVLDHRFADDKNIAADALVFGMNVETNKLPADLLRAYYSDNVRHYAERNTSGLPSAKQKRQAKDEAREKLDDEAKDGRFIKRKSIPVMWDRKSNEVLFGSPTLAHVDRLCHLFEKTFRKDLECVTAGPRAFHLAEARGQTRMVDDSAPSAFIPGTTPSDFAWIGDESNRDFLGNEFLTWLWYRTESQDVITALDDSEITLMIRQSLMLECARGQTGQATLLHEAPTRLGEAKYAIRSGKLPRKAGLVLVRHGLQFELTLSAETLAISAAKLPPPAEDALGARALLEDRIGRVRDLIETVDLLYDAFGAIRFGKKWESELVAMQKWLKDRG